MQAPFPLGYLAPPRPTGTCSAQSRRRRSKAFICVECWRRPCRHWSRTEPVAPSSGPTAGTPSNLLADSARSAATAAPPRAPFRHAAAAGRGTSTHRLSRRLEVLRSCTRVGSARCVQIIACIRTRCATYLPLTARYATRSATGPHTRGCATLSRPTALPHAVRPPHRRSLEPRRPGGPARPDLGDHDPPRASSAPLPRAPGCWHGEEGEAGALRPVERRAGSAPASHAPLHCAACAELRQDTVSSLDG